ncbi:MAG: TonB-dependent receptor [Sphingobacteriaceae bacterium]
MKNTLWATIIACLFTISLSAQTSYSVKGIITDTAANVNLVNTSVSVLNSKDSTLVTFTRTGNDGAFNISNLKPGKFILLVTYPKYADFVETFSLDSSKQTIDFGKLNLTLKSKLLADVIIKGKAAAIKIKGDTTEYNADSFVIEPNSKVEDLLRQLPGIQVDKDGKITAQGQTVNKVLVDGEEFFGDDPTLVTKNLRGDMIDKVQLYDKKSDQATFTGIDDGEKTKTINLKLKEDKKNGYFGKVDGGAADDFYEGQAMFNAFKAKRKVAAYGTVSNTAKVGLGREDSNKYGETTQEFSDEGYSYSSGRDDLRYNGQGIPSAGSGGVHYDAKWNNDKESINTNYKIGGLTIDGVRSNLAQTNLPQKASDGSDSAAIFNSTQEQRYSDYTFRQKFDATYQLKIDTTSNLKVVVDGTLRNTRNTDNNVGASTRENNIQQNNSIINSNNNGTQQSLFASIFYNKKLKKKGRTYSVLISQTVNNNDDEGFLYSKNTFYDELGVKLRDTTIDQLKVNTNKSFRVNSNITYTEPISKTLSLVLNYGLNNSKSSSDRQSYNKPLSGTEYNIRDTEFSNNFEYNQLSNHGGAIFNYKKDKTIINFGTKIDGVTLEQIDLYNDKAFDRKFININPQASYQYRFSQFKSFRINYYGNTSQPSINQIQPVRVNNDPLNIYLGNPDLDASFRSSFNVNYNSYKVLSERSVYIGANYSFVLNQIVNNTTRNITTGESTYQSLNLTDNVASNFSVYSHYSRKVPKLGFTVGLDLNISGSKNFNYINNSLNTIESNSFFSGLNARKYVAKKYNFWIGAGPSYYINKSSLQDRVNNSGGGFRSDGSFTIFLPGKLEISSNYRYNLTKKTEAFDEDVDYFIWNSSFSKKFLKDESLKLSLSGNDLLNQNVGFQRSSFSQTSYNTIRRYYMLSLLWDFNKMGGGLKTKN